MEINETFTLTVIAVMNSLPRKVTINNTIAQATVTIIDNDSKCWE